MTAGHNDRRLVKIRRRGRHSTPSQVERVAVQAGKAAPAGVKRTGRRVSWKKALERNLILVGYSPAEAKELVEISAA